MKKIFGLIIIVLFAYVFLSFLLVVPFGRKPGHVANYYLDTEPEKLGGKNVVTSVVLIYRGLDTLGEVTVLFLAALGVSALLTGMKRDRKKIRKPSLIVSAGTRYLFPMIVLFGSYIFVHGHLTPGGGFPGGVVIATAFLLGYVALEGIGENIKMFHITEGTAGLLYVITGMLGIALAGTFLENFLPLGRFGSVFSAGIMPVLYVFIGLKVGTEMAGLLHSMKGGEHG